MGKRFNVVTPRPKSDGGTWWHQVGSAWENDRGQVSIFLDSVPVPDPEKENKIFMMLFEPRERDEDAPRGRGHREPEDFGRQEPPPPRHRDDDDEIPF